MRIFTIEHFFLNKWWLNMETIRNTNWTNAKPNSTRNDTVRTDGNQDLIG